MMDYKNCEVILTKHFMRCWGDRSPIILKNQPAEVIDVECPAWVRFSVLRTARAQSSLGAVYNRRVTQLGRIFVQIFVRNGSKTSLLNELAGRVIDIYEYATFPGWVLLNITQTDSPDGADYRRSEIADGAWFNTLVKVQFLFDEIR